MTTRRRTVPAASLALAAALAAGLVAAPAPADAQIQPNRVYNGGEVISEPSLGLRLTIPDGWRGALATDGSAFMLESNAGDGHMLVMADRFGETEARQQMSQPMNVAGVVLQPAGEIREVATGHLSAPFTVTGAPGQYEATVDVRLTSSGLGVAFVLLAPPASAPAYREAMREFALSLGVSETNAQVGSGSGDDWQTYLRGRYLARFHTATGYTESTEIWLCSDGSFYFDDQGGGFGGGASGAFQSRGGGQWSATGSGANGTLILNWQDGSRTTHPLTYDYQQDRLYVDGERMLRGANERCR